MTELDDRIATYLKAIEVEGKTPKTIASYANSLQDFRRVGRRLGLPGRIAGYTPSLRRLTRRSPFTR